MPFIQAQGLWKERQPSLTLGSALSPQGLTEHPLLFQERLAVLDSQAGQIRAQAVQESERLARDKNASLQLLQKVAAVRLGWRIRAREGRERGNQRRRVASCAGPPHLASPLGSLPP